MKISGRHMTSVAAIVLILIGIGLLRESVSLGKRTAQEETECTVSALASIVDVEAVRRNSSTDSNTYYSYYPVCSYEVDGVTYTEVSEWGSEEEDDWMIGDTLSILCNEEDPSQFILADGESDRNFLVQSFRYCGIACLAIGILCLLIAKILK